MTQPIPPAKRFIWCREHGKRSWLDHAAARDALTNHTDRDRMHIYACDAHVGTFHIGHRNRKAVALDRVTEAGRGRTT